jgi:CHAD domain-containing protein
VGWRRFKSALRLFKSALKSNQPPSWQALKVLLIYLGELRDLEVAWTDTLAPLAITYIGTDSERSAAWLAMTQALQQATALKRKSVHRALSEPAVGEALLAMTQWLEELPLHQRSNAAVNKKKISLKALESAPHSSPALAVEEHPKGHQQPRLSAPGAHYCQTYALRY